MVPAPAEVARGASELVLREQTLHRELAGHGLVLPGLAVGIGIPAAAIMLPIGALMIVSGNDYNDHYDEYYADDPAYPATEGTHERRVGLALVTTGVLATAAALYGSFKIHSVRGRRRAAELELAAIRALRLVSASGGPTTAPLLGADEISEQVSRQESRTNLTSRGRMMITGGVTVSLDSPSGSARHWNLGLTPGFAYFIKDRFALGAYLLVARGEEEPELGVGRQTLTLGGGVRAIYEIRVGPNVGLWVWPSAGFAWVRKNYDLALPPGLDLDSLPYQVQTEFSSKVFSMGLGLPLMFHLTESWGIGTGPDLTYWLPVGDSGRRVSRIALSSFLVGSF